MSADDIIVRLGEMTGIRDRERLAQQCFASEGLFSAICAELDRMQAEQWETLRSDIDDPGVKEIVDGVSRDGIAIWRGMFDDPEYLREAAQSARELALAANEAVRNQPLGARIHDEGRDVMYPSLSYEEVVDYSDLPVRGRSRALWKCGGRREGNEFMARVTDDPRVRAVFRAFGQGLHDGSQVLVERMEPSLIGDDWHIDRTWDQLKAYVLLDDVSMRNGPTRYKLGTHRNDDPFKNRLVYDGFRFGLDACYPSPRGVTSMAGEELYGTGKAGDVLFFNTVGIHSGTRCLEGDRITLTVYPNRSTLKAIAFRELRLDSAIVI